MKNTYRLDVLKVKNSNPFISIIVLYFASFICTHLICLVHSKKVLVEMSVYTLGELSVDYEEKLRMIAATFNPNISLMAMMQSYVAYIIPLVVSVAFSFVLANEWEYKTIRIETVYKDRNTTFYTRLCFVAFSTYLIVVLTAYLNKGLNLLIWKHLVNEFEGLTTISVTNSGIKTYVMLFFSIILATVLYYTLAYLLTYGFGTNIPFIILVVGNTIKFDLWSYLPASLYKTILDNIFVNNEINILIYLFNPSAVGNKKVLANTSVHPVICVYLYLAMSIFTLTILFRKKRIY